MKEYQTLKGRRVFREVLKKGRRYYGEEIHIIVYQDLNKDIFFYKTKKDTPLPVIVRLGIQIQKSYGNAVKRNYAKRRVRAICRELLQGVENNFNIIIRPLENFNKLSYEDLKKMVQETLKKAGVL